MLRILDVQINFFLGQALRHICCLKEVLGSATYLESQNCSCAIPCTWQLMCVCACLCGKMKGSSDVSACAAVVLKKTPLLAASEITPLNCCCQVQQRFKTRNTDKEQEFQHCICSGYNCGLLFHRTGCTLTDWGVLASVLLKFLTATGWC